MKTEGGIVAGEDWVVGDNVVAIVTEFRRWMVVVCAKGLHARHGMAQVFTASMPSVPSMASFMQIISCITCA